MKTLLLVAISLLPVSFAINASPHPFQEKQPDGSVVTLRIVGNTGSHHVEDEDGYTAIRREDDDWIVYADEDESGQVKASGVKVGEESPREHSLKKGLIPPRPEGKERRLEYQDPPRNLKPISKGMLKNLVILLKFADHKNRKVPTKGQISVLFNRIGGHNTLAPSGSIRDIYRFNSYNRLNVVSTIMPWITLPKTEAYYADNNYGETRHIFEEALNNALNRLDNNPRFNFKNFDRNNDGVIDAITFLHSGFDSAFGGTDCHGQTPANRIWSHMSSMPTWTSKSGVKVTDYHIAPALWSTCGKEIGRVGVIAHELGHFLGLPDLYDTQGGSGIGAYDLMSNSWGFDGSQLYPPLMSAWSKIQLEWIRPRVITATRFYNILPSAKKPFAYKIQSGFPQGEYLLIENRQPIGFDQKMPHGGLAIWHIDENAALDQEGYPGQSGWPKNNNHYRVALLQSDGLYEMEKSVVESGDAGDLYYLGGNSRIGPSSNGYGPYPNTDAYQGGNVYKSGVTISNIGKSGYNMRMKVTIDQNQMAAQRAPAKMSFYENKLETTFQGGLIEIGCMFDIIPKKDMILRSISVHLGWKTLIPVEVWTRKKSPSSYKYAINTRNKWELVGLFRVKGKGIGKPTVLPFDEFTPLFLKANEKKALYVTVRGNGPVMLTTLTNDEKWSKRNSDLKITSGTSNAWRFKDATSPRIWNGGLYYDLPKTIKTVLSGESGQAGIMFDIKTHKRLIITGMDLNIDSTSLEAVQIWTKQGSHVGSEAKEEDWISIGKENMFVQGKGIGKRSTLESGALTPIDIAADSIQAFYITLKENKLRYSYGEATGDIFTKNEDLDIHVGTGVRLGFGETFTARVFNGVLKYALF